MIQRVVPMHRDTISIRLVEEALRAYGERGEPLEDLLREAGLEPALLATPESRVEVKVYSRLWRRLARRFDDEFFGMDPRRMRYGSFAFLCRTCLAQATLEDALLVALEFFALTFENFRGTLGRSQSLAEVVLHERNDVPLRPFTYFTFWLLLHGLACWLVGRRFPLLAVELRCAKPDYIDDYRVLFSENLRFTRPTTRIIFAAEVLNFPVRRSEADLAVFLRRAPSNILVKYRDTDNLAHRIKVHLRTLAAEQWPTSEALAQALYMSPSTLRRRLAAVGQPYQTIKDAVRQEMATAWLADPEVSLDMIAEHLGFADVSTFYKAFRKWTGTNPGHYRALILSPTIRQNSHAD
ncbi:transcriptional regulator, AraC family [Azotobacter beijerinckii]|uniref:Transcriptional regulator, AraC family n=2 Tax=Azotobacter beijerinckii TaxID=170623 RepID=A0A1H6UE55_9GAMM|nr:transcriptional regulator, AraC family [Azotobacter beijerinckii]